MWHAKREGKYTQRLVGKNRRKDNTYKAYDRCDYNIKTDFKETESEGVDWIHLAQNGDTLWPLVNTIMKRRNAQKAGKILTS